MKTNLDSISVLFFINIFEKLWYGFIDLDFFFPIERMAFS